MGSVALPTCWGGGTNVASADAPRITPEELERLDALAEAATPGPWRVRLYNGELQVVDSDNDVIVTGEDGLELDLIAAAITALPALVAEVRRLREGIEALAGEWEQPVDGRREYATLAFLCAADELRTLLEQP